MLGHITWEARGEPRPPPRCAAGGRGTARCSQRCCRPAPPPGGSPPGQGEGMPLGGWVQLSPGPGDKPGAAGALSCSRASLVSQALPRASSSSRQVPGPSQALTLAGSGAGWVEVKPPPALTPSRVLPRSPCGPGRGRGSQGSRSRGAGTGRKDREVLGGDLGEPDRAGREGAPPVPRTAVMVPQAPMGSRARRWTQRSGKCSSSQNSNQPPF